MITLRIITFVLTLTMTGCIGAGTLDGFDNRTFLTSKQNLVVAIDTLYSKHPEYIIPEKWKRLDDWNARGYSFLDSRIFYFKSEPQEMYYVTFLGNSTQFSENNISIAIRAVHNGSTQWTLESETSSKNKRRIQARFDTEIISKLEEYVQTKWVRNN